MISSFQFLEVLFSCCNWWSFPTVIHPPCNSQKKILQFSYKNDQSPFSPWLKKLSFFPCPQAYQQNPEYSSCNSTHSDPDPFPYPFVTWCSLVSSVLWPHCPSFCPMESQSSLPATDDFHMLCPLPTTLYLISVDPSNLHQSSLPRGCLPWFATPCFDMSEEHNTLLQSTILRNDLAFIYETPWLIAISLCHLVSSTWASSLL